LIFLDPDDVRINNNKIYYESIIGNRTLTEQQQKDDMDINDSSNLKLISTMDKEKKYQINNQRPIDYLEGREVYENLCRQNGSQVKLKYIYLCLNLFYSLVKSRTRSKIILSLSS
jgi:hypothetical protein